MKARNLLLALAVILCLPFAETSAQESDARLGYTAKSTEILEEYQTLRISEATGQHVYMLNKQSEPVVFSSEELLGGQLLERLQNDKATRLTIKIDGSNLMPYRIRCKNMCLSIDLCKSEQKVFNIRHTS